MAVPTEKEVETMPTQKIFKQRVRARMTKTGESYTAARRQLLAKSTAEATAPIETAPLAAARSAPAAPAPASRADLTTSAEAFERATGRSPDAWFAMLDAWGGTSRNHTQIARWLRDEHGVPGWWSQGITTSYERARGMRAIHQMAAGFTVGATKTVATSPERALAAFTNPAIRRRWLADPDLTRRPTKAALTARFNWPEPASRIVVTAAPTATGKTQVAIAHEALPDAETAERLKAAWRGWLGALKTVLEA